MLSFYLKHKVKRTRLLSADAFQKKVVIRRWLWATKRVQQIKSELLTSTMVSDFENSHKNLDSNLKKSMALISSTIEAPLEFTDLNETSDLI